ncbi:MAG: hypothetical protein ACLU37_11585 [Collinsella sp.]
MTRRNAQSSISFLHDRVFQAISMSSETRYPFILNLDTGESQWSVNAVRDFDLPSQHP